MSDMKVRSVSRSTYFCMAETPPNVLESKPLAAEHMYATKRTEKSWKVRQDLKS